MTRRRLVVSSVLVISTGILGTDHATAANHPQPGVIIRIRSATPIQTLPPPILIDGSSS